MGKSAQIGAGHAWAIVALLCGMYVFSLLDRMIPALLATALRENVGVTPIQFGLLVGTGFGVLYAFIGIPVAQWIDQGNRKWIIAAGVFLWGASTIASGFALNFTHLLIARAGVAIGEAALWPAAVSMIGDMFEPNRRTRPTTVFVATGQVMGSGLFLIGAGALALATIVAPHIGLAEWRTTFLIVGLPPVLCGLLWIAIGREPKRAAPENAAARHETLSGAVQYLRAHAGLYVNLFVAVAFVNMIAFSLISWLPTILTKTHGMTPPQAGAAMGLAGIATCALGASLTPAISVHLHKVGVRGAAIIVATAAILLATVSIAIGIASSDTRIVLAAFAFGTLGLAGFSVMPTLVIQWLAPAALRGRLVALNQFAVNAIGLAAGPPLVAIIALRAFNDENAFAPALATLVACAGAPAIVFMLLSAKPFIRAFGATQDVAASPTGALKSTGAA